MLFCWCCSFINIYVILCVVYLQLNYYLRFITAISSGECLDPGGVANASYTIAGLSIGSTVTYVCDYGYQYEAGYLARSCQSDGTWDGVPPVCSGMLITFHINKIWCKQWLDIICKMKDNKNETVLSLISHNYHHIKRGLGSKYIWFTCTQHPPQSTYYQLELNKNSLIWH